MPYRLMATASSAFLIGIVAVKYSFCASADFSLWNEANGSNGFITFNPSGRAINVSATVTGRSAQSKDARAMNILTISSWIQHQCQEAIDYNFDGCARRVPDHIEIGIFIFFSAFE